MEDLLDLKETPSTELGPMKDRRSLDSNEPKSEGKDSGTGISDSESNRDSLNLEDFEKVDADQLHQQMGHPNQPMPIPETHPGSEIVADLLGSDSSGRLLDFSLSDKGNLSGSAISQDPSLGFNFSSGGGNEGATLTDLDSSGPIPGLFAGPPASQHQGASSKTFLADNPPILETKNPSPSPIGSASPVSELAYCLKGSTSTEPTHPTEEPALKKATHPPKEPTPPPREPIAPLKEPIPPKEPTPPREPTPPPKEPTPPLKAPILPSREPIPPPKEPTTPPKASTLPPREPTHPLREPTPPPREPTPPPKAPTLPPKEPTPPPKAPTLPLKEPTPPPKAPTLPPKEPTPPPKEPTPPLREPKSTLTEKVFGSPFVSSVKSSFPTVGSISPDAPIGMPVKEPPISAGKHSKARTSDLSSGDISLAVKRSLGILQPLVNLIYWRDLKKSGIVFGSIMIILLSLAYLSLISVVAYVSLGVLSCNIAFRIYKNIMQAVQKSQDGHPFKDYLELETNLQSEKVHEATDVIIAQVNSTVTSLKSLFFVQDLIDSIKFGCLLWCLTYLGSWFNGLTLVILFVVALFTLPKVYEQYQPQIDQYIELVMTQVNDVMTKVKATLPIGSKEKSQ